MKRRTPSRTTAILTSLWALSCSVFGLALVVAPVRAVAEPLPAPTAAFNVYVGTVEARLVQQHRSRALFLAPVAADAQADQRLRRGELLIDQLSPAAQSIPGALLHHWRGTAFAPGATAGEFERLMRDFDAYPQHFAPQVLQARAVAQRGGHLEAPIQVQMRVRQRHILTVVMDTAYDVTFAELDAKHGYSLSRSTRIAEIESPGSANERALSPQEDHGFLWRQNTYWSYEERDGGLYMQVESVSLTRSIPLALAWAVQPFIESVPRESLEFTLRSTCSALKNHK